MREEVGEKRRIPPRRTFWRKMYAGAGMWVCKRNDHQGVLATKVPYFGVKSANVGLGPDGHLIC